MTTIKGYTDIEQSRKLAEILPLESADMFYNEEPDETYPKDAVDTKYPMVIREGHKQHIEEYGIPCWSLAALLGVLPKIQYFTPTITFNYNYIAYPHRNDLYSNGDNLVDACVAMIEKLHELKLLGV